MDQKPPRLTAAFIKSIDRPGRWGDGRGGNGLSIIGYTTADGGINLAWSQRILVDGTQRTFGLGRWPNISLTVARKRAFENIRKRDLGENIREPKRHIPTLGEAFDRYIANHTPEWTRKGERRAKEIAYRWSRSRQYWHSMLSKKVPAVTHDDVIDILRDDWHNRPAMAARVQNHLSQVLDQAVQMEIRASNPAARRFVVRTLGQQPEGKNHPAAPYQNLGGYLAKIRDSDFWWAEKYCVILLALTEDRSGELREAVWDDVDWDKETLTIPAERMKAGQQHVIPLSRQALEILRFAASKPRHSKGTIFPPQRGGVFMARGRLSIITKRLGLPFVPHGLRGSFANWAAEHENEEYRLLAKISIAHTVDSKSDRSYITTDVLEKRRRMLQEYADFLGQTCGSFIAPKDQDRDATDPDGRQSSFDQQPSFGRQPSFDQLFAFEKTA